MADEASDTFGGGIRNALGSAGFLLMMFGGYFIYEHSDTRTGPVLIALGFVTFILPWAWKKLPLAWRKRLKAKTLQYLYDKDSELGTAVMSMAHYSAWGRWYAARALVNQKGPVRQPHFYQVAAGEVMKAIMDGELIVRGRRPDPTQLDYETIDRTHWRSSFLMCVRHPTSLWQIRVVPKGGVELDGTGNIVRTGNATATQRTGLLDYDSFIVDAYQFEKLWPKRNWKPYDRYALKLLLQAWWGGLDANEIKRLWRSYR